MKRKSAIRPGLEDEGDEEIFQRKRSPLSATPTYSSGIKKDLLRLAAPGGEVDAIPSKDLVVDDTANNLDVPAKPNMGTDNNLASNGDSPLQEEAQETSRSFFRGIPSKPKWGITALTAFMNRQTHRSTHRQTQRRNQLRREEESSGEDGSVASSSTGSSRPGAVPIQGPNHIQEGRADIQDEGTCNDHNRESPSTQRDDEFLLTAELVNPPELVDAVEIDLKQRCRTLACFSFCVIVLGAIIGTVIAILVDPNNPTPTPPPSPVVPSDDPDPPTTPPPTAPQTTPAPTGRFEWNKLGKAIRSEETFNNFGSSVSMNYNGSIVAIGSENWMTVYQYDSTKNRWARFGQPLVSSSVKRVFLDDEGRTFTALSGGNIYKYGFDDSLLTWNLRVTKTPIDLNVLDIDLISVSSDGGNIVAGVKTEDGDEVRVYRSYASNSFSNRGIVKEKAWALSISQNGDVMVISAGKPTFGPIGYILVYHYGRNDWITPPSNLSSSSEYTSDAWGRDVVISSDGKTIAVSDYRSFADAGSITIFSSNGVPGDWKEVGIIVGDLNAGETFANSDATLVLSSNGEIVGSNSKVGFLNPGSRFKTFSTDPGPDPDNPSFEGHGSVLDFNTDDYPCSLSGDGYTLCCGSPYDLAYGDDAGVVTCYRFSHTGYSQPPQNDKCEMATSLGLNESMFGDTEFATVDDDVPACDGVYQSPGLWYHVSTSVTRNLTLSTCADESSILFTLYWTEVGLFSGSCNNLTCVEKRFCNISSRRCCTFRDDWYADHLPIFSWIAEANVDYYVLVNGYLRYENPTPYDFGEFRVRVFPSDSS